MEFSLIITSQNRNLHLINLLEGVKKNSLKPSEIIIVSNDAQCLDIEFMNVPTNIINFESKEFDIGINRNLGAYNAKYEWLHFLDVDCIPEEDYFSIMNTQLIDKEGLIMGQPLYLGKKFSRSFSFNELREDAIYHPYRPRINELKKEDDYALFWSLCFSISKYDFEKIGGFDDSYKGYGAEDTDFSFMAKDENVEFYLSQAKVYHQQHPISRPPVNHLEDIVKNSNHFYEKWGKWPMGSWLREFAENGWILWNEDSSNDITILNLPTDEEVKNCMVENGRFV